MHSTCSECGGSGRTVSDCDQCSHCKGKGQKKEFKQINVSLDEKK